MRSNKLLKHRYMFVLAVLLCLTGWMLSAQMNDRTFTTGDITQGYISFHHPDNWYVQGDFERLIFANNRDLLNDMRQFPTAGQIAGNYSFYDWEMLAEFDIFPQHSLADAFDTMLSLYSVARLFMDVPRHEFTMNDKQAAYVSISVLEGQMVADAVFFIVQERRGYSVLLVLTGYEQLAQHLDLLKDIATSVDVQLPGDDLLLVNRLSVTMPDLGQVTLYYPRDWVAETSTDLLVAFATDVQTLHNETIIPAEGQAIGQLMILPDADLTEWFGEQASRHPRSIVWGILKVDASRIQEFEVNGKAAAMASRTFANGRHEVDVLLIVIDEAEAYSILSLNAPGGTASYYEGTLREMARSLTIEHDAEH